MLSRLLLSARSALRPSLTKCVAPTRALSSVALAKTAAATTRPTAVAAVTKVDMSVVTEQVRGMKVRSSVKKLCEGCKVCFSAPGPERRGIEANAVYIVC
jgi:large subunit ribosomal protein L36